MQTRKRAKSVTFGKKNTESEEKEHVKKTAENEEVSSAAQEAPSKVEAAEEAKESHEEPQSELSTTPPKTAEGEGQTEVTTPSSEFVSDNPLSSPELPKEEKEH